MWKTVRFGVVAAALLAIPAAASAQEEQGNGIAGAWTVTLSGGAAVPAGSEFHQGGRGTVLGLATAVDSKKNSDVFNTGFGFRGGVGYGVSRNVEVFGDFEYRKSEASELSVGNVATLDLRAAFGDYKSYGVDGGVRYHFAPAARINPYLTGRGGFRRVEAISGTFTVPAAGVTLSDVPFFDDSTVPVFGGGAGVIIAASDRIGFGIEGGFRYHPNLTELEGLAGTGLENLNDAGSDWSIPISGVVRLRF